MDIRVFSQLLRQASGRTLDPRTRQEINSRLARAGLDGNGRFLKVGQALARAWEVLAGFGIEQDEVVNANRFLAPSGTVSIGLAWTNQEDLFSPEVVSNSDLYLQWTVLETRVEVVAYVT